MKKTIALLLCAVLLCGMIGCATAEEPDFSCIRINEFVASNGDSYEDENGESPDWIELYNTSDKDINLKGLCLSDGKKTLDKFVFPDWIIPAHGYVIVLASGYDTVTATELHTSFKLSADGERVVISYNGEILDIVSFDAQEKDIAYARVDEKDWQFTLLPTPGAENQFVME